jgi:TetR/AcrR family transcriptional repressor of nem operon
MGRPQVFNEEKVIGKAMQVFWHKGFSDVSTKNLIDATGLSNGSFFNSFKTKANIYFRCLQQYDKLYIAALVDLLQKDLPFKLKMEQVFKEVVKETAGEGSNQGCFFFNAASEAGIDDDHILGLIKDIDSRLESAFLFAVDMAKQHGELANDLSALPFAQYLYNVVNGLRVLLLRSPSKATIKNVIQASLSLLPVAR